MILEGLPGLANKNTEHPVKCEFQINNEWFFNISVPPNDRCPVFHWATLAGVSALLSLFLWICKGNLIERIPNMAKSKWQDVTVLGT